MIRVKCDCGKVVRLRDNTKTQCRVCWGINRPNRRDVGKKRKLKTRG